MDGMMDGGRLAHALGRSELLDAVPPDRRPAVVRSLNPRQKTYRNGEAICRVGETAASFWVLTRGSVTVTGQVTSGETLVERREAGSLIGELAAIKPGARRSATVRAHGHDVEAYCISMAALDALPCEDRAALWRGIAVHVATKLAGTVPSRNDAYLAADAKEELLRLFVNEHALGSNRSDLRQEYEHREVVVWFSDLAGFSALASAATSEETAALVKRAMTIQSDAVEAHGGYVDKFMGDGMMAYWLPQSSQPKERRRVADAAVRAAMDALEGISGLLCPLPDHAVSLRIGLNISMAHIGNFGSDRRWAFTLVGQPVNVAARLEQAKPDPACPGDDGSAGPPSFGPLRVSPELAEILTPSLRAALPDTAATRVKTDDVTFIHRKPE